MCKMFFPTLAIMFAAIMIAFFGCAATKEKPTADVSPIDVNVSELSTRTKIAAYLDVVKSAADNPEIAAIDEKIWYYEMCRHFWLGERTRTEQVQKRGPKNFPKITSNADLFKEQRKSLYEINLQHERIILIDEYIRMVEKEIEDLEAMRRELITTNTMKPR